MACHKTLLWVLALALSINGVARGADAPVRTEVQAVTAFQLTDAGGKLVEVEPQTGRQITVVCFLGTECPLARHYGPRLNTLAKEFADRKVRFIGINSNSQDSSKEVAEFAREHGITFPLIMS